MMNKYSVLMSVYFKESPDNLRVAMDSMFCQTVPPDEFVLVCDGPLNNILNNVIIEEQKEHSDVLKVLKLPKNVGLGKALQFGLKHCSYDVIARMDSDDISLPDRCEKQLQYLKEHPDIAIIGGSIAEFQLNPGDICSKRVVPEKHEDIVEFSKFRNPFNHMTVMFRKDIVLLVGGYKHLLYLEDYYLWIRLFQNNYKGYNLPDVLVNARVGNGMFKRRSGIDYAKQQKILFSYMLKTGYITKNQYVKAVTSRTMMSIVPNVFKEFIYDRLLRQ